MMDLTATLAAERTVVLMEDEMKLVMGNTPLLVHEMFELFARMRTQGTTLLLVERNVERALSISDRAYILDQGRFVHTGDAQVLLADHEIQERCCAVRGAA